MKKTPLILIFFFTSISIFSQETENNGFLKFPQINDITDLVKKINPNRNYRIWAFVLYDFKTNEIIYQKGNKKISPKRLETDYYGFFPCLPGGCYYYFYVIGKNEKEDYIIENNKLINFFGEIDRIEEALFIAMGQGYGIDNDYKNGNIYKEFENEFILYLSKISYSPYKKEVFMVTVDKKMEN